MFIDGPIGHGRTLDGTDDYVTIPYAAGTSPATAITVSIWVKFDDKDRVVTKQTIINNYQSQGWSMHISSSNLRFNAAVDGSNYSTAYPTSNLNNGEWYHVVGTYDGTDIKLYVNGALVATNNKPGGLTYAGNMRVCIGAETSPGGCGGGWYLAGSVDDAAVWQTALSLSEIQTIYNRRTCRQ